MVEGPGDAVANTEDPGRLDQRIEGILQVAAQVGVGVPISELAGLLPESAPRSEPELRAWLTSRPDLATLREGRAFSASLPRREIDADRARLGGAYWEAAKRLRDEVLRPALPWVAALGLTGSAAYGEPERGDDVDLLAITRPGALWVFLTHTYLALQWAGGPQVDGEVLPVCLNYVKDAMAARREFSAPGDFLFAREALTARILWGDRYYAGLLAESPWMGREIPRLFAARRSDAPVPPPPPAPWPVRLLNLVVFPWMAAYLQVQALRRNAHLRQRGEHEEAFRITTRLGELAIVSLRFERRRRAYGPAEPRGDGTVEELRRAPGAAPARTPLPPVPGG